MYNDTTGEWIHSLFHNQDSYSVAHYMDVTEG